MRKCCFNRDEYTWRELRHSTANGSHENGVEIWGGAGFPVVPLPNLMPDGEESRFGSLGCEVPHLRSMKERAAYHIQASDGEIGHVTDFVIDDASWEIRHLIVETGHWLAGTEIAISPAHIDRISYEESKVFVAMTKESIVDAPEYHVPTLGGASSDAPFSLDAPNRQAKSVSL